MHKRTFIAALTLACTAGAWAQPAPVAAHAPWARASVQGQRATGVFVTLVANEPLTLVGASSPVAAATEVHEMKMEGDVMRMRAIDSLSLPAKQPVQLKPGGYHLMLQELKAPLQPNTSIPLTLTFRTARGEQRQLALQVPVSTTPPKEAGAATAGSHHRH
jgi:copper(I)-binding protein